MWFGSHPTLCEALLSVEHPALFKPLCETGSLFPNPEIEKHCFEALLHAGWPVWLQKRKDVPSLVDEPKGTLFLSFPEEAADSGNVTTLKGNPALHDRNNSEAELLFSKMGCANWHCSLKIPLGRDLCPADLITRFCLTLFV